MMTQSVGFERSALHALDAFDVPFICICPDGMVTLTSQAAERFLESIPNRAEAVASMARMAITVLRRHRRTLGETGFEGLGEFSLATMGTMAVHRPRHWIPDIAAVLVLRLQPGRRPEPAALSLLTPREREVAELLAEGAQNKEIAARLSISEHTARHHTERLFGKLGARNRSSVARLFATASAYSKVG